MFFIDEAMLGHLGTEYYEASNISYLLRISTFFLTNTFILNNLCSQAIGANNPKLAGIWFEISLGFSFLFSVPCFVINAFS
mmetsp:Transcript_12756/g.27671  ORF Transcript_12756/g.27671 Transcript_12756/m.27671 type:complete len:81 (+) Transcript_12756:221-463(+)